MKNISLSQCTLTFGILALVAVFLFVFTAPPASGQTLSPDINGDTRVDIIDLGILLSSWGRTDRPRADLNQDGRVDVVDLGILLSNWGKTYSSVDGVVQDITDTSEETSPEESDPSLTDDDSVDDVGGAYDDATF